MLKTKTGTIQITEKLRKTYRRNKLNNLYEKIRQVDTNIAGNIQIRESNNILTVFGQLSTSKKDQVEGVIKEHLAETYPGKMYSLQVSYNQFLVIDDNITGNTIQDTVDLDEIKILYMGMMPTTSIINNYTMKMANPRNKNRMDNAFRVMNFIAPIVVNQELKVIDGQLRLEMAQEYEIKEVPVIVVETSDIQMNTLRIALNRSSELQRWSWTDVDNFVDDNPQIQPILESLGVFGRYVLPESYFANSVIEYEIDPFNLKKSAYKQEWGLAKWAEMRRKEMQALAQEKYKKKKVKKKPTTSLFNLKPKKEDFLETYDPKEEIKKWSEKWRPEIDDLSRRKDEWSKARKEALGQEWQVKARLNKDVAKDNKEQFFQDIRESNLFTESEIELIEEDIFKYAHLKPKEIRELMDEDGIDE